MATRPYHGLFVPDLPSRGRTLLIPRLDETVEQGTGMALLSGAEYADGRIEMDGIQYLKDIRWEWQTPIWMFDMGHAVLEKRIIARYGQSIHLYPVPLVERINEAASTALPHVSDARRQTRRR